MPYAFADRVWFNTTTVGTGTLSVGTALISYQVPATAGIASGSAVNYVIVDGVGWEVGKGVLTSGTPWTLSRDAVEASSASGAKLSLSGNASCFLTVTAAMLAGQPISVMAFGAKGDGVTDDTAAINAAIAAAGVVFLPGGGRQFLVSGTLTLPASSAILGTEGKATIVTTAANFSLIRVTGSDVTIKNLKIQNGAKTGGVDILLDTGSTAIQRIIIEDIESYSPWGFLADTGTGTTFYVALFMRRVRALSNRGADGFKWTRVYAYLVAEDCYCDVIGQASPLSDYNCFALDNALIGGLPGAPSQGKANFTRCIAAGNSRGAAITGNTGFHFNNTDEIWLTDCRADSVDGYGFVFANVNYIHIQNSECSLVNGPGWTFDTVLYLEASNLRVYGRSGVVSGAAGATGISLLTNCGIMSFSNPVISAVYGDGINIPGQVGPINITGGRVIACTGWGIETSGSYGFLATGMQLTLNGAGNYNLLGPNHYLHATQINSGGVVYVGPGPISG